MQKKILTLISETNTNLIMLIQPASLQFEVKEALLPWISNQAATNKITRLIISNWGFLLLDLPNTLPAGEHCWLPISKSNNSLFTRWYSQKRLQMASHSTITEKSAWSGVTVTTDFTNSCLYLYIETEEMNCWNPTKAGAESRQFKYQGKQAIGQSHSFWRNGVNKRYKVLSIKTQI